MLVWFCEPRFQEKMSEYSVQALPAFIGVIKIADASESTMTFEASVESLYCGARSSFVTVSAFTPTRFQFTPRLSA